MTKFLLQCLGWLLAHTHESLLHGLCRTLGWTMLRASPRRRRIVLSNLDHAFPERPQAWREGIAFASSCRLFETALLSLAGPYLSEKRIRRIITTSPEAPAYFARHNESPRPLLVSAPHIAYWECLTWLGMFLRTPLPEFGVIFRPLDNPTADAWVKSTRERFGMRLLSRKTGLQESFKILKRNGTVGVLFDQNAGMQGALTTLLGRVCSTSELPGLLVEKSKADVIAFYARRLGFWRVRYEIVPILHDGTAASATLGLNRWLENALSTDDALCGSWLWSHDRWRNQDVPERRFRLEAKRNLLGEEAVSRGWNTLPRKTRIWIRMPNWLGDVVMALPLLEALRVSRPDAEITLIAKAAFLPLLQQSGLADHLLALPAKGSGYFRSFWKLRSKYPDVYVLFTHSARSDIEARLGGCRQRFGVVRTGKSRSLLTHVYRVPGDFDEAEHHQLELWENFFRHFGLSGPVSRAGIPALRQILESPDASALVGDASPIFGFIAGSENTPEKRWPIEHWRQLAKALTSKYPAARVLLFGTSNDRPITGAIAEAVADRSSDLAGKTDLPTYMALLRRCSVLISNDTGGMHLANALGVPLVALFGPTNPVRTGPVFQGSCIVLQPPGCAPTGGARLADLSPEQVEDAVDRLLK